MNLKSTNFTEKVNVDFLLQLFLIRNISSHFINRICIHEPKLCLELLYYINYTKLYSMLTLAIFFIPLYFYIYISVRHKNDKTLIFLLVHIMFLVPKLGYKHSTIKQGQSPQKLLRFDCNSPIKFLDHCNHVITLKSKGIVE